MNTIYRVLRLIGLIYLFYINFYIGIIALLCYSVIFVLYLDKILSSNLKHILWIFLAVVIAYLYNYTTAFLWFYKYEQGSPTSVLYKGDDYVMPAIPTNFLTVHQLGTSHTLNYGYQILAMFFLLTLVIRLIRFYILRPYDLDSSHWNGVFGFFAQGTKAKNFTFEAILPFTYTIMKYSFLFFILKRMATFMSFAETGQSYPMYSILMSVRFVIAYPLFSLIIAILLSMFIAWVSQSSKPEDPYLAELRRANELAMERLYMYW